MKQCPKCQISHNKSSIFCSRKCANSRTWTEEDKKKKSISGKKSYKNNPWNQNRLREKKQKIFTNICTICEELHGGKGNTCSKKCFSEQQRINASNQILHGGGKKGNYKGIQCDSTYELSFVIYHMDQNILIQRCNIKLSYIYNGKICIYIPDFIIDDKIYEIKGYMCERAKEKLKQNPNVILIDKDNIKFYLKYVREKYNVNKIEKLYDTHHDNRLNKKCPNCHNNFKSHKNQKFCSHKCSVTHPKSIEHRLKLSKATTEYHSKLSKSTGWEGRTRTCTD